MKLGGRIPKGHNLAYILVHEDNPAIIDLGLILSGNNQERKIKSVRFWDALSFKEAMG